MKSPSIWGFPAANATASMIAAAINPWHRWPAGHGPRMVH
jgi:hypothetical protein